jgi:TRAP-type C4-dicarboxylate transport system substrate-binding protein
MVDDLEKKQWEEIAAKGMKINDVDKKPFQQAVLPVYEKFKGKLDGKIIDDIVATLKK